MKKTFALLTMAVSFAASAQMTPVGLWHTIDDETNQPKGEIRITENNGVLSGVVGRALKEDPKAKTWQSELAELDPNAIAPMDELLLLQRWKKEFGN